MPNYCYLPVWLDNALTIIDVEDPRNPVFTGSIQGAGAPNFLSQARAVYVRGQYAYVVSYLDDALSIFDVSDPALPVLVGSIQGAGAPNFLNGPWSVWVSGNYAFICAIDDNSFTVIDVSDVTNPTYAGRLAIPATAPYNAVLRGNYAYLCSWNDRFYVIDISTPTAPAIVGQIGGAGAPNFLNGCYDVAVAGDYAYVVSNLDDALSIFRISDPFTPTLVGSIQGGGAPNYLAGARGIQVSGNYAYIAAPQHAPPPPTDDSLTIIDISDPTTPTFAASIRGAGAPNFLDAVSEVYIYGNYAYCAAVGDASLTIIDISDPLNPTFAGNIAGAGVPNFLNAPRATMTGLAPAVTSNAPTLIGETGATLNGTLDADGDESCDCSFEYGPTVAYGTTTTPVSRTAGQTFSTAILGLVAGTLYHFRAVARNSWGVTYGSDMVFVASVVDPLVVTEEATNIDAYSARLNALLVFDGGAFCDVRFEYGLTTDYGTETAWQRGLQGGASPSRNISDLASGRAFQYRAVAWNGRKMVYGNNMSFTTLSEVSPMSGLSMELATLLEEF